MRFAISVLVLVWLGLAPPVFAASPMVAAFQEYQAARAKGDVAAADHAGETAWQAAEAAGNAKYTAILAYNLAELRMRYEPGKDALSPAKRALETAKDMQGALPISKAALLVSVLETKSNPDKNAMEQLIKRQQAFDAAQLPPDFADFLALHRITVWYVQHRLWSRAQISGEALVKVFNALNLQDKKLLSQIQSLVGAAYLLDMERNTIKQAEYHFDMATFAVNDFDFHHIPAEFLQAVAWGSMARALINSWDLPENEDKYAQFQAPGNRPDACKAMKWAPRKPLKFPEKVARQGKVGAVILVYDLNDDGSLKNIRIGAEVPAKLFGDVSVKAAKGWKMILPEGLPADCKINITTSISYRLRP